MNSKFARPITAPQTKIAANRKQRRQMKQFTNMTAVERVERELEAQGKFGA